jgi:hypothetical protein
MSNHHEVSCDFTSEGCKVIKLSIWREATQALEEHYTLLCEEQPVKLTLEERGVEREWGK